MVGDALTARAWLLMTMCSEYIAAKKTLKYDISLNSSYFALPSHLHTLMGHGLPLTLNVVGLMGPSMHLCEWALDLAGEAGTRGHSGIIFLFCS
jgi:hypothetical protein